MLVPVYVLVHVVQAALVAPDVLAALLLAQAIVLAHALDAMAALDVVLVVQVDARVDVHILAVLNVPDAADVQLVVVKVALLLVDGIAVVVLMAAQMDAKEHVKANALQPAEDASLVQERVLQDVKVDAQVALDVLADACIRVPVDALLVVTNAVQHVGAVAMVARDVQDVLIRVMANAVDVLAAVKADAIVTVLLLVLVVPDVQLRVMDVM